MALLKPPFSGLVLSFVYIYPVIAMAEGNHPYGTTLLARDTPENRKLFPDGPFGDIDVAPTVCTENECPYYNYRKDATHEGATQTPIHLLIASFRDRLCPRTLHNAFTHAENPKRIFIRIIEQTKPNSDLIDDAGCWDRYCQDYNKDCQEFSQQVRTVHVDSTKAKGPTDARSKLSAMISWDYLHRNDPTMLDLAPVQLQDFCMQTDSHMDFSDNFDTELIYMFHRAENDYAVLSTYVADIEQNNQDVRTVPNLCMVKFTATIRNWGTKQCKNLVRPKLTNAMWGAGLSFHRCHAELNVPVDPYLDEVFDGEEGSRGLRFFTFGYDVYTPDRVLVTHDYHGHQSNPIVHTWGQNNRAQVVENSWKWMKDIQNAKSDLSTFGTTRVNMMLGIGNKEYTPDELKEIDFIRSGRFGLGTKRTLEQAIEFSGIDLKEKKMVKNKCGNLIWVPFEESADYGIVQVFQRGLAGGVAASLPSGAIPTPTSRVGLVQSGLLSALKVICGVALVALVLIRITRGRHQRKGDRHKN